MTKPHAATVVRLAGELDVASAPGARELIEDALAAGAGCVVVDLADVTFVDSTGLGALVAAKRAAQAAGVGLPLVNVAARHRRVIRLSGLADFLALDDDTPAEPGQ